MKRIILSLLLCSFFTLGFLPANSQALLNSCPSPCMETPLCTDTSDCFKFDLFEPRLVVGDPSKTIIRIRVTNYSSTRTTHAGFTLPNPPTPAWYPANGTRYNNLYSHNVTNPYNVTEIPGMQHSILYAARVAQGSYSNGLFEEYLYVVNTADLNAPGGRVIIAAAKAGAPFQRTRIGHVFFNLDNCFEECPDPVDEACFKADCCFSYQLDATTTGSDPDESLIAFAPITNLCGNTVTSVTMTLPNGYDASRLDAQSFSDHTSFNFSVNTAPNPDLAVFTVTDAGWNASGEEALFGIDLPRDLIRQAGNNLMTVTVNTNAGSYSQTFNLTDPACGIGPLPVELMRFDGKAINEGVALNWKTASEKNNDRFEVQRSTDGQNFERIGTIKGNGNSTIEREYGFIDKQPLPGLNYYRLNQVDFDGTSAVSKVIKVTAGEQTKVLTVQLTPNPCRGENCTVQLSGFSGNNKVTIELRDLTGRLVFSKQLAADQTSLILPSIGAENGIYILSAKDGSNVAHQKVIIQ